MHIKEYNGIEIKYPGPDIDWGEIFNTIQELHFKIEDIGDYPEKSLFFQDPDNITEWLHLVKTLKQLVPWDDLKNDGEKWENRTETYVDYLITLRAVHIEYQNLYKAYYEPLKKLLEGYGGWLEGKCVSSESLEELIADQYEQNLEGAEDITQFVEKINDNSHKARFALYDTLSDILTLLLSIMNRGGQIVIDMNPSMEDIAKAIDDDLKEWTRSFGKPMLEDMKEDLTRHYKAYRTAPYTPELWGELLSADEDALLKASRHELAKCDAIKQEHWGEDMKKKMDEHGDLAYHIYSSCRTEKLFDLSHIDNLQEFINSLASDNLSMFYDIIVRRNLIQCEMFPDLKKQHEVWLNSSTVDNDMPQAQADGEEDENNEEFPEEERFHYIHVEIEDEEAWRIHRAIKRLVANFRIPDICNYLKEQQKNGKLMLPSDSSAMYNELVRLGMPKGKGFSEKNFSNSYTK